MARDVVTLFKDEVIAASGTAESLWWPAALWDKVISLFIAGTTPNVDAVLRIHPSSAFSVLNESEPVAATEYTTLTLASAAAASVRLSKDTTGLADLSNPMGSVQLALTNSGANSVTVSAIMEGFPED